MSGTISGQDRKSRSQCSELQLKDCRLLEKWSNKEKSLHRLSTALSEHKTLNTLSLAHNRIGNTTPVTLTQPYRQACPSSGSALLRRPHSALQHLDLSSNFIQPGELLEFSQRLQVLRPSRRITLDLRKNPGDRDTHTWSLALSSLAPFCRLMVEDWTSTNTMADHISNILRDSPVGTGTSTVNRPRKGFRHKKLGRVRHEETETATETTWEESDSTLGRSERSCCSVLTASHAHTAQVSQFKCASAGARSDRSRTQQLGVDTSQTGADPDLSLLTAPWTRAPPAAFSNCQRPLCYWPQSEHTERVKACSTQAGGLGEVRAAVPVLLHRTISMGPPRADSQYKHQLALLP
ncbi:hypothetical protein WMY93_004154 [Mugilogobius chulae]|uniref:Leucine-rich repeat-containing protein 41 n=1 Tax=Mugilogobius chulae TaxID=88201 RepID=A0AAW0PRJ3_9GOBI